MKKLKDFISNVFKIYNPIELVLLVIMFFGGSFGYFYLISNQLGISLVVGFIGFIFFFYVQSYQTRLLEMYQNQLNNLLKYITNMKFFLQTGENVLYSYTSTLPTITDKYIRKDIEQVIDGLENQAILQTEHFEKYNFPSLNQFHQNLAISYQQGGDPHELFDSVQKNMLFELDKRDELYKKRKGVAMNVNLMLGLVALIPILLRFMVASLWEIFLSYKVYSLAVLLITIAACFVVFYLLQKKKIDISVRI